MIDSITGEVAKTDDTNNIIIINSASISVTLLIDWCNKTFFPHAKI